MDSESCNITSLASTRVNGRQMLAGVEVWNATPTVIDMKANFSMASRTERACTHGQTVKYMRANGLQVSKRDKESGKVFMETLTSESGTNPRRPAMVFTCGRMETGTKANGRIVSSMAKVQTSLLMVTVLRERIIWENPRVKANTSGKTKVYILENSETV